MEDFSALFAEAIESGKGFEEAARKAVAMFVRYNRDPSKRRVRAWKDVVEEMDK